MNNDGTPHEPNDEISVTEVSDQVLEELSSLFGGTPTSDPTPMSDPAPTAEPVSEADQGTTNVVPIRGRTGSTAHDEIIDTIDNVVWISDPDETGPVGDPTPGPRDPLLTPLSRGAGVIEIEDDIGGDVVYDADDLDRVVIVDDDRPSKRHEERERRRRRRERLRKVKWFKIAGTVAVAAFLVVVILASPLFAVRHVRFEGVVYTSDATVARVTKKLKGSSVFTVDTAAARQVLLDDPWVADVRITTDFPGSATVEVSERTPVVWYAGTDTQARVIDARGHVITVLKGWPTRYLQVRGTGADLDAGAIADDVYRAAAQLVLALPDELRGKVKALDLTPGGELSVILKGGTIIRFGLPTDLQNKLVSVVVLLRRQDPGTLAVVDVSTGEPTVQVR